MMEQRPDPDQLLKQVQADEEAAGRGRLKLFFGASPGVGKTYAMLEAARQRKKEGIDVVIGIVETHGRLETAALLEGLEVMPRKSLEYKGVHLHELDLDGVLTRKPALVLIDELAHTNAPTLRHAKRWQDVEEILDSGIDVYTTLNVQHWESLNDVVAQVTGIVMRETVPDTFLKRAHEIELVDLAPEDLLQRLKDGKVYRGEQAARASDNFFKPGNLIALRELAMRHAAERVDAQMQAFRERHAIAEVWSVGERLLVGVTGSPMSARLIRAASRMATRLRAPWIAVHVETPAFLKLSADDQSRVIDHLRLAEKLGGEPVTVAGADITDEILALARARNVSRIILGKPARPRWKEWLFGSVVNEMAHQCGTIDLHIISGRGGELSDRRPLPADTPTDWAGIGWGAGVIAICTLVCWPFSHTLDKVNLVMIYLAGVVWTAYRWGRWASIGASILSVFSFDFFFVPPRLTMAVSDTQYVMTFSFMLGVGLLISTIMSQLRQQTQVMRKNQERMRALYTLSRELSETPQIQDMLQTAGRHLGDFYQLPLLILTPTPQRDLEISVGDRSLFGWTENEHSVARWVFDKGQIAGAGSDTLSGSTGLYLPLKGIRSTVGVLALRPRNAKALQDPEQLQLLEAFASEIGGALESTRMSEEMGRAELQAEMQALHQPPSSIGLRLSDVVIEKNIVRVPSGLTSDAIFKTLVGTLDVPNKAQALQAILEREKVGGTIMESGVAIPHARIPNLTDVQVALGINADGPLYVWVLFLGPSENPRRILSLLACVSAFFQKPGQAKTLSRIKSPKDILQYIRQFETPSL